MAASTVFAEAVADVFAEEDLTVEAVYKPASGTAYALRAIQKTIDKSDSFLTTGSYIEGIEIKVQAADVPAPAEEDKIALGVTLSSPELQAPDFWNSPAAYIVRKALPNSQRLIWTLDVQVAG